CAPVPHLRDRRNRSFAEGPAVARGNVANWAPGRTAMRHASLRLSIIGAALLLGVAASASAQSTWDKLTYFTFSGPVAVPGVSLPAGTYEFRLANPSSGSAVILIQSRN